jgi:hypothetical protein
MKKLYNVVDLLPYAALSLLSGIIELHQGKPPDILNKLGVYTFAYGFLSIYLRAVTGEGILERVIYRLKRF